MFRQIALLCSIALNSYNATASYTHTPHTIFLTKNINPVISYNHFIYLVNNSDVATTKTALKTSSIRALLPKTQSHYVSTHNVIFVKKVFHKASKNITISNPVNDSDTIENNEVFGDVLSHPPLAAGDIDNHDCKYRGLWINPFGKREKQRKYDNVLGYKIKNYGATIGTDLCLHGKLNLGLAFSHIKSNINFANKNKGKATTNLVSFYGTINLPRQTFISWLTSLGFSAVSNKRIALPLYGSTNDLQSSYDSKIYTTRLVSGVNYKVNSHFTVTPIIGLGYVQFNDNGYTEKSVSQSDTNVSSKSSSNFNTIMGCRISAQYTYNDYKLLPEISGFTYVNLKNNAIPIHPSDDNLINPLISKISKSSRTWYSFATALRVTHKSLEYKLGYETQLDKKYIAHQFTIKLRKNL